MSKHAAISPAIENFYAALNTLFTGDAQPMKDAWSHTEGISYMGPEGAYLSGWQQIGPMWDSVGAAKLGGRVTAKEIRTVVEGELALLTCIEAGENVSDGQMESVNIRSSTVFRLESGHWKVIHHQTDLLGFLNKA